MIKKGQKISSLTVLDIISSGGMAIVVRAATRDGHEIALKIAKPDEKGDPFFNIKIQTEVEILQRLINIDGVVKILPMTWERKSIYHAIVTELTWKPGFYAMELLIGRSLHDHLKRIKTTSIGEAAAIGYIVAKTLNKIHHQGIVHNDIKPDNIVFRDELRPGQKYNPVLVDFGVSEILSRTDFGGIAPLWAAPEKLEVACANKPSEYIVEPTKTDIWSLGIVLYRLLMGNLPYQGKTAADLLTSIRRRQLEEIHEKVKLIPKEFEEIIVRNCLAERPSDRPSAQHLAQALMPYAQNQVQRTNRSWLG